MSRASVLLSLQQIDDRIATLTSEIAVTEASLRGDPELERLRGAEAAAHEEHRTLGASAKLAELEAASLQARIRELDRRLYGGTVRNPAELMEMQRELEVMRTKLSIGGGRRARPHGGRRRVAGESGERICSRRRARGATCRRAGTPARSVSRR